MGLTIGIDIDNVVCNSTEQVLKYINERAGTNLELSDITNYFIEDFLPDEHRHLVSQAFHDKEMWRTVTLLPDVKECVERLQQLGNEIYFVTATTFANINKKSSFLRKHFPQINIDDRLINIRNKQLLRLDILIDDYLENLLYDRTYYSVAFDYPWNQTDKPLPMFTRAKNWNEVVQKVLMIESLIKENEYVNKNKVF